MNRIVKIFKKTVFLSEQCALSKVTTRFRSAIFLPLIQTDNRFPTRLLPCQ